MLPIIYKAWWLSWMTISSQSSSNSQHLLASNCLAASPIAQSIASMEDLNQDKIRKVMKVSEISSAVSSTQVSEIGAGNDDKTRRKSSSCRQQKRGRCTEEQEKPKVVVHVRARRGQATDSHSLAERVRREQINGIMRCLQDLVPGCYKTMRMAVILDETINYV